MSDKKQDFAPLTEEMEQLVKNLKRGGKVCWHTSGEYYHVTTANSVLIKSRNARGLINRGILQLDNEAAGYWYVLSELGKTL